MGLFDLFNSKRRSTKRNINKIKNARKTLDNILDNNPKLKEATAQVHFEEGTKYIEQQDWQNAITSLKLAVRNNPKHAKAQLGLCVAYGGAMDLETAQRQYEVLKELDPSLAEQLANTPAGVMILQGDGFIQI